MAITGAGTETLTGAGIAADGWLLAAGAVCCGGAVNASIATAAFGMTAEALTAGAGFVAASAALAAAASDAVFPPEGAALAAAAATV